MHPEVLTFIALLGTAMPMWVLADVWRIIVLDILFRLHRANKQFLVKHIVAAHMRLYYKYSEIDYSMEELSETFIEVLSPFVD